MLRKHHIIFARFTIWTLFLLALSFPAFPQITTASLEGVVRDPTGAVIAGARVQVANTATNVAAQLATDTGGRFLAPSLPPGPYAVSVQAAGFKRLERSGILLDVNQTVSTSSGPRLSTRSIRRALACRTPPSTT